MPEGDTIFRAARTLHKFMAGHRVTRFDSVYPAVTRLAEDDPVVGRIIDAVSARGKHLLFTFSGDLVLRTHLRMNGSWHIYPAGARWRRPARDMRVLVCTADACAVGFNIPDAELISSSALARHRQLQSLGPDLLDQAFNRADAIRRIRERGDAPIAEVLLDQRVLAGIGNVFKSEILFLSALYPFTPVATLSEEDLERVVDLSRQLLAANVMDRSQTLSPAFGRRTTRSLDPDEKLWVYSRGGKACRRCGTAIEAQKSGLDARLTYWCPTCQPSPAAGAR